MTFQEHNEDRAGERIMALLADGKSVAIVSEAGTPGISDPGYTIVQRAIAAGEAVTMAPGPAAAIMAVVLSGLALHSFTYAGSLPIRGDLAGVSSPWMLPLLTRSCSTKALTASKPFSRMRSRSTGTGERLWGTN